MKIVSVVGNRPQFIKAAPVARALEGLCDHVLVNTGQHYDADLSQIFFEELGLRPARSRCGGRPGAGRAPRRRSA